MKQPTGGPSTPCQSRSRFLVIVGIHRLEEPYMKKQHLLYHPRTLKPIHRPNRS